MGKHVQTPLPSWFPLSRERMGPTRKTSGTSAFDDQAGPLGNGEVSSSRGVSGGVGRLAPLLEA